MPIIEKGRRSYSIDFSSATLTNTNFTGANLTNGVQMNTVDLTTVIFGSPRSIQGSFDNSNWSGLNMHGFTLTGTSFANANFTGTDLSNVTSVGDFQGANFTNKGTTEIRV